MQCTRGHAVHTGHAVHVGHAVHTGHAVHVGHAVHTGACSARGHAVHVGHAVHGGTRDASRSFTANTGAAAHPSAKMRGPRTAHPPSCSAAEAYAAAATQGAGGEDHRGARVTRAEGAHMYTCMCTCTPMRSHAHTALHNLAWQNHTGTRAHTVGAGRVFPVIPLHVYSPNCTPWRWALVAAIRCTHTHTHTHTHTFMRRQVAATALPVLLLLGVKVCLGKRCRLPGERGRTAASAHLRALHA